MADVDALVERARHLSADLWNAKREDMSAFADALAALREENERLRAAFNPRKWDRGKSQAWDRAIPDVQKAFEDLLAAALAPEVPWIPAALAATGEERNG